MITNFFDMIKEWTASDYCTPGIKAEVILDMLISDFVGDLLTHRCKEKAVLLTKELPIWISDESNRNAKVDYLVAIGKKLLLVELKTTSDSYCSTQNCRMNDVLSEGAKGILDFYKKIASLNLKGSAKAKYNYSMEMYNKNLQKSGFRESDFTELDYMYILLTDVKSVPDSKKLILTQYCDNADFRNSLTENRRELWDKVSEILLECAGKSSNEHLCND